MARARFYHAMCLGVVLAALSACGGPPARPEFGDIRFNGEPKLHLAVSRVEFVREYQANLQSPHIEEKLPVPLSHVTENWVRDRLEAVGGPGRAVATVVDASVIQVPVPTEGGISGTFTKQVDTRYEARLALRVEIKDDHGFTVRTATAQTQRSQTTVQGISLDERDRILYRLETDLAADLDRQLESDIRANFGSYLQ
ncbi:MAG TPA: hypothetical protein VMU85_20930 [Stellaceae bacterium]|nr:hypothetical protein [Stellaceae bacterium]